VRFYCTYFDSGYLTRGLALVESLRAAGEPFRLFVLCMDTECARALGALALPELTLIPLADLEAWDPAFAAAKADRSRVEYYYTCSPVLPLYIFQREPQIEQLVYLDADLYFFASPAPLFHEIGSASVAIIAHRFGDELAHLNVFGRFNVGFLAFRRTPSGLGCLRWWRERTIEWCRAELDGDRYADQKYLDRWPTMVPDLVEIAHEGANVAPWNVGRTPIEQHDGRLFFKGAPLIFYHFHGIKKLAPGIFQPQLARYFVSPTPSLRTLLYGPYLAALERAEALLRSSGVSNGAGSPGIVAGLLASGGAAWREELKKLGSSANAIARGARGRELIYFVAGRAL